MAAKQKTIRTSSLPRLALCPGSFAASQGLESKKTAESESGDRVHLALQSHYLGVEFDESRLTDRESMVFRWFRKEADALIEKHGGASSVLPEYVLGNPIPGTDIILTGHVDLVVICEDGIILIFDWKSGFLEVPPAKNNLQLVGYCWGVAETIRETGEVGFKQIHSYLFSSGSEKAFTGARFSKEHLAQSGEYIRKVAMDCMAEDAPRCPGNEQCRYCPAKCTDRCPESRDWVRQAAVGMELMKTEEPRLPADKQEVVRVFKAIKQVESFGRKFMSMLKTEVVENPEAWEGMFELEPGNTVRSLADVQSVYNIVVGDHGLVDTDTFLRVVALPIGDLEALLKDPLKDAGVLVKNQKEYLADMLGDLIETKQNSPSIKVVG